MGNSLKMADKQRILALLELGRSYPLNKVNQRKEAALVR